MPQVSDDPPLRDLLAAALGAKGKKAEEIQTQLLERVERMERESAISKIRATLPPGLGAPVADVIAAGLHALGDAVPEGVIEELEKMASALTAPPTPAAAPQTTPPPKPGAPVAAPQDEEDVYRAMMNRLQPQPGFPPNRRR